MSSMTDILLDRLGDGGVEALSRSLGSNPQATKTAAAAALPMLFAALAKNARSDDGAAALAGALERDHDGSVLEAVQDGFSDDLRKDGDGILKHVLGARRGMAEAGIAKASGLDSDQASAMLATLAPLVMGTLGQAKRTRNLDTRGVTEMLRGEDGPARDKLGGLAGLLDRDGDGSVADDILGGIGRSLFGKR